MSESISSSCKASVLYLNLLKCLHKVFGEIEKAFSQITQNFKLIVSYTSIHYLRILVMWRETCMQESKLHAGLSKAYPKFHKWQKILSDFRFEDYLLCSTEEKKISSLYVRATESLQVHVERL